MPQFSIHNYQQIVQSLLPMIQNPIQSCLGISQSFISIAIGTGLSILALAIIRWSLKMVAKSSFLLADCLDFRWFVIGFSYLIHVQI